MQQSEFMRRLWVLRYLVRASLLYAWICLKNFIKILIGRDTYFPGDIWFLPRCLLHLSGFRPIRKITYQSHRDEGACSQAIGTMSVISFCRATGLAYVHSPFTAIAHAERPAQEWASAWEGFFNLGVGESSCDATDVVFNYPTDGPLELCFGFQGSESEMGKQLLANIGEFRRKYYRDKTSRTTREVSVAVHVRRGDVSAENNSGFFTATETVVDTANAVKSILNRRNLEFRIGVYSNGEPIDFEEFARLDAELFIKADAVWTLEQLIEADVLIMARGTYSFYAGLMSDGIRLYEPNVLQVEDWIVLGPDGSFDTGKFEWQLAQLLQAKAAALAIRRQDVAAGSQ